MARRPFTPDELLELRELAAAWGKIVARRAFGDDGPGLDVDFEMMEQIAHVAAQGLTEGTLQTLLAGQSGVGKSSLLNALAGDAIRTIGRLSERSGEGRHTTVSSAIIRRPWGELADSPGVRDYTPAVVPPQDVQRGFVEIGGLAGECRFQDCLHLREPQCAVQAAVDSGAIDPRRYESYRRLLSLNRQLDDKRGWRA